jgi:3-oxoacyl-[acyl-carrier-protein] synthase II
MSELQAVVLTGIGAITARGDFTSANWQNISATTAPDDAFTLADFALEKYLESPKTYLDRASALALAGCALALRDAAIAWPVPNEDFGITLGTHLGCIETMRGFWDKAVERGVRVANPLLFSHSYFNSPISLCAIEYGLKGYHATICAGENSGFQAVQAAFDAIRLGHASAMVCGGVEATSPTRSAGEGEVGNGEASVFFVLESSTHATQRGAKVLCDLQEATLQQPEALSATVSSSGHCGGAQSTLTLLQQLSQSR